MTFNNKEKRPSMTFNNKENDLLESKLLKKMRRASILNFSPHPMTLGLTLSENKTIHFFCVFLNDLT
jgi:hypothetical protein